MRTILDVDDHADSLERGKALLATDRRRVIGAGAGRDALALAKEHTFWRCIACDADWLRPTGDPLHQETQCMRCDGLLVLMEA